MSRQKCPGTVQYLRKSQSFNFGRQKHVPAKMWMDSPVFEEISIRQFWSAKTRPGKNVDGQSSIWGNLNLSILVGKNTSWQKFGRTVQYLRKSKSVNFGRQKHVPVKTWSKRVKTWREGPVKKEISIRQFWSAKTRPGKNVGGQSSIWRNLNPSILVGKNMSR